MDHFLGHEHLHEKSFYELVTIVVWMNIKNINYIRRVGGIFVFVLFKNKNKNPGHLAFARNTFVAVSESITKTWCTTRDKKKTRYVNIA